MEPIARWVGVYYPQRTRGAMALVVIAKFTAVAGAAGRNPVELGVPRLSQRVVVDGAADLGNLFF